MQPRHEAQHINELLLLVSVWFLAGQRLYDCENANERNEYLARSAFHIEMGVDTVLSVDLMRVLFGFGECR